MNPDTDMMAKFWSLSREQRDIIAYTLRIRRGKDEYTVSDYLRDNDLPYRAMTEGLTNELTDMVNNMYGRKDYPVPDKMLENLNNLLA